jgi:hypothetical protein
MYLRAEARLIVKPIYRPEGLLHPEGGLADLPCVPINHGILTVRRNAMQKADFCFAGFPI